MFQPGDKPMIRKGVFLLFVFFLIGCGNPKMNVGPPLIADPGVDPDSWAFIPAGEFLAGQFNHEEWIADDFEIMVTHVTNQQYAQYLNEALTADAIKIVDDQIVGYYPGDEFRSYRHEEKIEAGDWLHVPLNDTSLRLVFDGDEFTVIPGYENHPMTVVTWFGAKAYCDFYGWRLPLEFEWEKAARGEDGRPYPWGDDIEQNQANYYSSGDPFEEFNGKQGDTTPVGFYNGSSYEDYVTLDSASPYGLYDMAGNVEQWMGDVYELQHYRYLRGGSKALYAYNLRVWTRNNATPTYFSPNVGFRCARTP
jgi:formylglycine-generating enzyme required for sulfatase activity